jgi:hypothetical protein
MALFIFESDSSWPRLLYTSRRWRVKSKMFS